MEGLNFIFASFPSGGRGPQAKETRQLLEAGKKKEKGNAAYQEFRERNALEQGSANGGS